MGHIIQLPKGGRPLPTTTQIGIVIQARMTSKRFPGKSLALLDGKPIIEHVINRAKLVRASDKIKLPIKVIVAVPDTPESEPLLVTTFKLGVSNFCGPEDNVLERYMGAANFYKLNIIMRITADCPLIDPKVCSEVLQLLMWRKVDYASNIFPERTFPKGLDCEVFTYDALEVAYVLNKQQLRNLEPHQTDELKQLKYDQEHVTPYMQRAENWKRALVRRVEKNMFDDQTKLNYCIDYPEDIKRLEDIIAKEKPKSAPKLKLITSAK